LKSSLEVSVEAGKGQLEKLW